MSLPEQVSIATVRPFRLLRVLGEGRMGRVYRARMEGEEGFSREVALRVLPDPARLAEARAEARHMGPVRDRALVDHDEPERLGRRWAVSMELVEGVLLSEQAGPLPLTVALEIVGELARCLDVVYPQLPPEMRASARGLASDRVMVGRTGQLKLLGLGRALDGAQGEDLAALRALLAALSDGAAPQLAGDSPRALERGCYAARAGLDGPGVREWVEALPPARGLPDDALVGRVLTEGSGRSTPRAYARLAGWIGAGAVVAGALTWAAIPRGTPQAWEAHRVFSHGEVRRPVAFDLMPDGGVVWSDIEGLWISDTGGGPPVQVPLPEELLISDLSALPDGRLLIAARRGESHTYWVVGGGGQARALGTWPMQHMGLSQDGRTLAMGLTDGLLLVDVERGGERYLQRWDGSSFSGAMAWSPDGRWIAVGRMSITGGEATTWVELVDTRTGAARTVLTGTELRSVEGANSPLAWTSAHELIFFRFAAGRRRAELRRLDLSTGEETLLLAMDARSVLQLRVRGDRSAVLTGDSRRDVFLTPFGPAGFGPLQRLTDDEREDYPDGWLPDGRVLLSTERFGSYDLLAAPPDRAPVEVLVGTPARERSGAWVAGALHYARKDPDGWWWLRREPGGERRVRRLSDPEDGVWELYCGVERCVVQGFEEAEAVWRTLDPLSGAVGPVFFHRSANPWPLASLSPDGSMLAVVALGQTVELVEVEGEARRSLPLVDERWVANGVGWRPDGASLIVTGYRGEDRNALWWMGLEGELLGSQELGLWTVLPLSSPSGDWVAYSVLDESSTLWSLGPSPR